MFKRIAFIILFAIISFTRIYSQNLFDSTIYKSFRRFDSINWSYHIDTSYKFIFSSECHAVSCNYDLSFSIINYQLNFGPVNLIIEYPFSFGIIYNKYLETGDSSILNTLCYSKEEIEFWNRIYSLQKSLPSDRKVKVWGVDFELGNTVNARSRSFPRALKILIENKKGNPPLLLSRSIDSMIIDINNLDKIQSIKNILKDSLEKEDIIAYWGSDYNLYKTLISRDDHFKRNRNDKMYENFLSLYNDSLINNTHARFFAQFGYGHSSSDYKKSFASLLLNSNTSPVRNRVFILYNQYINCYSTLPANSNFLNQNSGPVADKRNKSLLMKLANSDSSRIKIVNEKVINDKFPSMKKEKMNLLILLSNFGGIHLNDHKNNNENR